MGFIIGSFNSNSIYSVISLTGFILFTGCIFFAFIHTQYSSIHACIACGNAMISTITKLMTQKSTDLSNIEIDESYGIPKCIIDRLYKNLKLMLPHRGNNHPLIIMWEFFPMFRWASSDKEKRKTIKDPFTQEAAIYWLLLVHIMFTIIYLWISYCYTLV